MSINGIQSNNPINFEDGCVNGANGNNLCVLENPNLTFRTITDDVKKAFNIASATIQRSRKVDIFDERTEGKTGFSYFTQVMRNIAHNFKVACVRSKNIREAKTVLNGKLSALNNNLKQLTEQQYREALRDGTLKTFTGGVYDLEECCGDDNPLEALQNIKATVRNGLIKHLPNAKSDLENELKNGVVSDHIHTILDGYKLLLDEPVEQDQKNQRICKNLKHYRDVSLAIRCLGREDAWDRESTYVYIEKSNEANGFFISDNDSIGKILYQKLHDLKEPVIKTDYKSNPAYNEGSKDPIINGEKKNVEEAPPKNAIPPEEQPNRDDRDNASTKMESALKDIRQNFTAFIQDLSKAKDPKDKESLLTKQYESTVLPQMERQFKATADTFDTKDDKALCQKVYDAAKKEMRDMYVNTLKGIR